MSEHLEQVLCVGAENSLDKPIPATPSSSLLYSYKEGVAGRGLDI